MKKMILAVAAFVAGIALAGAQDLKSVTDLYNAGAEAIALGDKAGALGNFKQALKDAEALGDEGAEIASGCKNIIPGLMLSIGKDYYNIKDFDTALEKINEAAAVAKEYGNEDVAIEAESLVGQVVLQKDLAAGNEAFKAKDFATAAEMYGKVMAADSTNKTASIRLLQSLANIGDLDGAKAAYAAAVANGKEADANKVLGSAFLKKAAAALKAGKNAEAVAAAKESFEFTADPKAYQIAGQASSKMNKDSDAIGYFEKYLEIAPDASNAGQIALTVGALYHKQGNKAKALEFYKKAQALGQDAKTYIDAVSK